MQKLNAILQNKFFFYTVFLLVLFLGFHSSLLTVTGYSFLYVPGDMGDPRFINTVLEHGYQWLCGNTDGFWDASFMFPQKASLTFSDNLAGNLPLYSFFRLIGFSFHGAFLGWLFVTVALNFFCSFVAFRYFTKNQWLSLAGAFLFTFSLALVSQYFHVQMTVRFMIPLFFMFMHRYFSEGKNKFLFLSVIALAFQFYLTVYLGFLLAFCGFVFFICCFIYFFKKIRFDKKFFLGLLGSLVVITCLVFPLMYPYYERSKDTPYTDFYEVSRTIPTMYSYLSPPSGVKIWPVFEFDQYGNPVRWMHTLFPGGIIVCSLLALPFIIYYRNDKQLLLFTVFTALFSLFFLKIHGYSLFEFLRNLPGMGSVRVVTRIINMQIFFFVLLFLWVLAPLVQEKKPVRQFLVFASITLLCFFDQRFDWSRFSSFSRAESNERVQSIVTEVKNRMQKDKHLAFAVLSDTPENFDFNTMQLDAMMAAYVSKTKTVNAYTSFCKPAFGEFWWRHNELGLSTWMNANNMDTSKILIIRR